MLYLVLGNMLYALHYMFAYSGTIIGGAIFAVPAGVCEVLGITFFALSIKRILGLDTNKVFIWTLNCIHFIIIMFFKYFYNDLSMRRSFTTLFITVIILQLVFVVINRRNKEDIKSYRITVMVLVAFVVYKFIMSAYRFYVPITVAHPFEVDISIGIFNMIYLVFIVVINFAGVIFENDMLQEEVIRLSQIDHLTKLYNRRYFMERLEEMMNLLTRGRLNFSIMIVDIDNFKHVNDTYGHNVGDQVLIEFASFLEKETRDSDIVARYGGEEFIVLLHANNFIDVEKFSERLLDSIHKISFSHHELKITFSGGCVLTDELKEFNISKMISIADERLYQAKACGKDQVIIVYNR